MKFLCIGHIAFDTTLPVCDFPIENTKMRVDEVIHCGGGPASNAAYLLASWKMDTKMIGAVGNDFLGEYLIEEFKQVGVDTTYIESINERKTTKSYIVANTNKGSRTILTVKEDHLTVKNNYDITKENSIKVDADVILVDGEEYKASVDILAQNPNAISIIDAGRVRESTVELCKLVNYVVCSKDFALSYTKKQVSDHSIDSWTVVYQQLKQAFPLANIIITLEAGGCFTQIDGQYCIIPSIKVKPIDSTGAGDIFHGAFTYFLANSYPLEEALILSNITGALSTLTIGGRNSVPQLAEVFKNREKYDILKSA